MTQTLNSCNALKPNLVSAVNIYTMVASVDKLLYKMRGCMFCTRLLVIGLSGHCCHGGEITVDWHHPGIIFMQILVEYVDKSIEHKPTNFLYTHSHFICGVELVYYKNLTCVYTPVFFFGIAPYFC